MLGRELLQRALQGDGCDVSLPREFGQRHILENSGVDHLSQVMMFGMFKELR